MNFLKKASLNDLINNGKEKYLFSNGTSLLERYKEFELFLTQDDLKRDDLKSNIGDKLSKLLKFYKAYIRAVHCPESRFKTTCDSENGRSTNYLSIDEAIHDRDSRNLLIETVEFAKKISDDNQPVVVILHAGSFEDCTSDGNTLDRSEDNLEEFVKVIEDTIDNRNIRIAIENVTPYYDNNSLCKIGENEGWGNKFLAKDIEKIIELNNTPEKDNIFGVCVDYCHLIVDFEIKKDELKDDNQNKFSSNSEYIEYFTNKIINSGADIFISHVSNIDERKNHGMLFEYNRDSDESNKLLDTIKECCKRYSDSKTPITLEMAQGSDIDKACENFDNMVSLFSCMHKVGVFGKFLNSEDETVKAVREFFDCLFELYSIPLRNIERINELAWKIKTFVISNSHTTDGDKTQLIGFSRDMDVMDTALLRLKVYILYTRFCNLGKYLAEVYASSGFSNEDFALSMLYFMFDDDKIQQVSYTGVGFALNIDFLPKKTTLFRFNDGIKDNSVFKFEFPSEDQKDNWLSSFVERIRKQIDGTKLTMYSCGKNFLPCLYKYYSMDENAKWKLRIYKDILINYFEIEGKKYSVPAFLHLYQNAKGIKDVDFSLDISSFRNGRDGEFASLSKFIKLSGEDITKTTVGSITDGEVVASRLPEASKEYNFNGKIALSLAKLFGSKRNRDNEYVVFVEIKSRYEEKASELTDLDLLGNLSNEEITTINEFIEYADKSDRINGNWNHWDDPVKGISYYLSDMRIDLEYGEQENKHE